MNKKLTMLRTYLKRKSRSVKYSRNKNKDVKVAFKAPGGKILPLFVLIILILCNITSIISGGVSIFVFTSIIWGIGILFYFYQFNRNKKKIKMMRKVNKK